MNHGFQQSFEVGGLMIGEGRPALVVAELGGNAGQNIELAIKMIDAAKRAGAGAVKFQAYKTGRFIARNSRYYDELAREELSPEDLAAVRAYAKAMDLIFLASAFDFESLEFLARLEVQAVKIASGDITNLPLLEAAAGLGKPIFLSTGASDLEETSQAVEFLKKCGANKLIILHCAALYPCPDDQANLLSIPFLRRELNVPVGYSDHTEGVEAPLAALALGACIIEKHFTVDRNLPGGDNSMSCLPDELALIAQAAPKINIMLGRPEKRPSPGEMEMRSAIRRSIAAARDIKKGEILSLANLDFKRPGQGLPPGEFYMIKGRKAACDISADEFITPDMVE